MADFSLEDVKTLRERLGTGMVDTKNALVEAGGDMEKAVEILRLKGAKGNAKRADRSTAEGLVAAHSSDTRATMIELACETDFVAKGDKFVALADKVLAAVVAANADTVDAGLAAKSGDQSVADLINDEAAIIGEKIELRRIAVVEGEHIAVYMHQTSKDLPRRLVSLWRTQVGTPRWLAEWQCTSRSPTRNTSRVKMSRRVKSRTSERS